MFYWRQWSHTSSLLGGTAGRHSHGSGLIGSLTIKVKTEVPVIIASQRMWNLSSAFDPPPEAAEQRGGPRPPGLRTDILSNIRRSHMTDFYVPVMFLSLHWKQPSYFLPLATPGATETKCRNLPKGKYYSCKYTLEKYVVFLLLSFIQLHNAGWSSGGLKQSGRLAALLVCHYPEFSGLSW